jgi:hypothetical protein
MKHLYSNVLLHFYIMLFTFTECDIWKYGANCESVCSCDTTNTEHCNPVTGLCRCKPGWKGTICKDDVNECEIDNICQSNSMCNNTVGSFGCDCNTGYIEANKGECSGMVKLNQEKIFVIIQTYYLHK